MYDPVGSHAATHINDNLELKALLIEAITGMELIEDDIATHIDLGRTIGVSDVVRVGKTDEIVYAARANRAEQGLIPFVKNRQGNPCTTVAMHLVRNSDRSYMLLSGWIGVFGKSEDDEPFPQAPDATPNSASFWDKRAFVYGSQETIVATETTIKPW